MARYSTDNTEGYTAAELATLNAEYDRRAAAAGITCDDTDDAKTLSERVLADFDTANPAQ